MYWENFGGKLLPKVEGIFFLYGDEISQLHHDEHMKFYHTTPFKKGGFWMDCRWSMVQFQVGQRTHVWRDLFELRIQRNNSVKQLRSEIQGDNSIYWILTILKFRANQIGLELFEPWFCSISLFYTRLGWQALAIYWSISLYHKTRLLLSPAIWLCPGWQLG